MSHAVLRMRASCDPTTRFERLVTQLHHVDLLPDMSCTASDAENRAR
jgi:hypothetical protein